MQEQAIFWQSHEQMDIHDDKTKQKSCETCKFNMDGGCALDAEKVCFKPDDWHKNEPYEPSEYTCWEAKHFNDQKGETK